jgi:AraC-like DNA-binding protein
MLLTHWSSNVTLVRPVPGWPEVKNITEATVDSPSYYWDGKLRSEKDIVAFQYTIRGNGKVRYQNQVMDCPVGSGFLFQNTDPELCYYYPKDGNEPWNFIFVNIKMEAKDLVIALTKHYGPIHVIDINHPVITKLLQFQHHEEIIMSAADSFQSVSSLLQAIAESHNQNKSPTLHPLVQKSQKLLSDGDHLKWNVSQWAQALSVSREHLTRVFQKEVGKSPHQYLTNRRMDLAKHLLCNTQLSCKIISTQCGFETPALFGRSFKKHIGISPAMYRTNSGV